MTDQANPFARFDHDGKPVVERGGVGAILEGNAVEDNLAIADRDRLCAGPVLYAERCLVEQDQFFHIVDRTLQVADVLSNRTQVSL